MVETPRRRARGESIAIAIAGLAFAGSLLLIRNATPVPPGMLAAAAVLIIALGVAPLAKDLIHPPAATLVRGAGGLAAGLLFFLSLGAGLEQMALPLATALAGATLLQADARATRSSAARTTIGSGLVLSGLVLAWLAAPALPDPARLRTALVTGAIAGTLGMLVRLTWQRTSHHTSAPNPVGILSGAALIAIYFAYRPAAAARVSNLAIYEWAIAVSAAILLLGRLRRVVQDAQTPESWASDATRHAQDVRPIYDPRMTALAETIQRYLDTGDGFEAYERAIEASHGAPIPRVLTEALRAANARSFGLGRKAKDHVAMKRLAAHEVVIAQLTPPRGPTHGRPERTLRPNP